MFTAALALVGTGGGFRVFVGIEGQGEPIVGFELRAKEAAQALSHGRIGEVFHEEFVLSFEFVYG